MKRLITKIKPDRSGITLVEILIALAICGTLGAGVITAIYQIYNVNSIDKARVTAVKQVENALHYINRDVQMAQNPNEGTNSSFPLVLAWKSWVDNVQYQVTYDLDGAGNLTRDNGVTTSIVAKNIDIANGKTNWTYDSDIHKMTIIITASVQAGSKQATETRKIEIIPRPGS